MTTTRSELQRSALSAIRTARGARNPDALRLAEAVAADNPIAELYRRRVAAGLCRHCGGPLPCPSRLGDVRPGERH